MPASRRGGRFLRNIRHHGSVPAGRSPPRLARVGYRSKSRRGGCKSWGLLMPSRPGEFHPEPLTDPDLTLSRHPARAIARRLPPAIEIGLLPLPVDPRPMAMEV